MAGFYLLDYCSVLAGFCTVNNVRPVFSYHGTVRRNFNNVEVVYFSELVFLGESCTRHTRELMIHSEVVLEGDCRDGSVFLLNLYAFLCFESLMQTVGEAASGHDTACERVNDKNFIVLYNVVRVAVHYAMSLERLIDMVGDIGVFGVGVVLDSEVFFSLRDTGRCHCGGSRLFVYDVVSF